VISRALGPARRGERALHYKVAGVGLTRATADSMLRTTLGEERRDFVGVYTAWETQRLRRKG